MDFCAARHEPRRLLNPEVTPLPPHITPEKTKHLTESLIKGDPRESGVIMGAGDSD